MSRKRSVSGFALALLLLLFACSPEHPTTREEPKQEEAKRTSPDTWFPEEDSAPPSCRRAYVVDYRDRPITIFLPCREHDPKTDLPYPPP